MHKVERKYKYYITMQKLCYAYITMIGHRWLYDCFLDEAFSKLKSNIWYDRF